MPNKIKSETTIHHLYSIGHGNRSIKTFTDLLLDCRITHLADIRSYPRSKRNPHFNQKNLQLALSKASISYTWIPELGGLRRKGLGNGSPHVALRSPGFRNYADYMATEPFRAGVDKLRRLASLGPTCCMCAESVPQRCHRSLLADFFLVQDIKVIHLLDSHRTAVHELSRLATVNEHQILYDRIEPQQLKLNKND